MMRDPLTSAIDKEHQKMTVFGTPPLQNYGFGGFAKCDFQMKLAVASGMTYIYKFTNDRLRFGAPTETFRRHELADKAS